MGEKVEQRQHWSRIIGVERRGAPIPTLEGRTLPDPTKLLDEDFEAAMPQGIISLPVQAGPDETAWRGDDR